MSEINPPQLGVHRIVMPSKVCTTCGKEHEFPVPKFKAGQRVRLVSDAGYHHRDKVGQETTVIGVVTFLVDPCDKVEYQTEFGHGNILECRLVEA